MVIIGHRGAAGIAPENTIESIEAGIKAGADMIEFDIRLTKDIKFVLNHDETFERTCNDKRAVSDLSYKDVKKLRTKDGHKIPTLEEALKACGSTPALIEAKGSHWSSTLTDVLKTFKGPSPHVTAYDETELVMFKIHMPQIETYILEKKFPWRAIRRARENKFSGINLIHWLYNPIIYRSAKKLGLKQISFTVNPSLIKSFHKFYPEVMIVTNYPDAAQKLK